MKLKLDEDGHVVVQDGKPVYVHDDGKEVAMDVASLAGRITFLTAEAEKAFAARDEAKKSLKAYEGIEDPDGARKAIETLANLDAKKLVDAGDIEKVKAEISKAFQGQLDQANEARQKLEDQLYGEKIGGSFARSKVIAEKLAIPADMVQARFGSQFKVEDGKVVAYDTNGNKIYSRARPGEVADFDEAIESLIEQYPYKDHILKGSGASGGGAQGGVRPGGQSRHFDPSKLAGTPEERRKAFAARFPELEE